MRLVRRLGTAAAVAVTVAGCGATALSTSVLRNRAGRVCTAAIALERKLTPPTRGEGTVPFLRDGIAVLIRERVQLATLEAGGDLAPVYRHALAALDSEVEALRVASSLLSRGGDPIVTVKALEARLTPLENRADAAWSELQIPDCFSS